MRIITKGRGQGKTTDLIRMSAESGAYIVTALHRDAWRIATEAERLGLRIPFPLTAEEFQLGRYSGRNIVGLLFDNADTVLQAMSSVPVLAMSVTPDGADGAGEVGTACRWPAQGAEPRVTSCGKRIAFNLAGDGETCPSCGRRIVEVTDG